MARTMSDAEDTVRYWLGEEFGGPVTGSDHDQFNAAVRGMLAELDAERAAHERTKAERDYYRDTLLSRHGGECIALLDELTALKARLALAEATINTLQGYAEHGSKCVLSRWEAGRPTPDGGYEWKYAGMWYDADNLPACECDLGPVLAAWRAAK